jgi:hypothetical protein
MKTDEGLRNKMREHEQNQVNYARRDFLRVTGSAGAIGAVAVLMGRGAVVEAAPPVTAQEDVPAGSYRETEHIRKYYYCAAYW